MARQPAVYLILLAGIAFGGTPGFAGDPQGTNGHDARIRLSRQEDAVQQQAGRPEPGEAPFIIVRENNYADELPERFRTTDMPLDLDEDQLRGLRELGIMGGGQPSQSQLRNIVELSERPVIVFDLRQEPHGHIAGMPVTWFRPYISDLELGIDTMASLENEFVEMLKHTPSVQVDSVEWTGGQDYELLSSEHVGNETARSNAEVAEQSGARYVRFFVPVVPSDQQIARFEAFVDEISDEDVAVYFHCWDGTGRSTEFMVMYDILKNGREVSLQTIAKRHEALGGINVLNLPAEGSPNYSRSVLRRNFIIDYYQRKSAVE